MELEDAIKAGGKPLLDGWLDMALMAALPEGEDDREAERAFKLAAAREAVDTIAGEGAPLEERMQAVLYVVAHMAAIEQQARAASRYLDDKTRRTAQRFACQLMGLTGRQLAVLERLRRARRKAAADRDLTAYKRDLALVQTLERQQRVLEDMEKPPTGGATPEMAPPGAVMSRQMRRAAARRGMIEQTQGPSP